MQDGLTRAQHYRALAAQMRDVAQQEPEIRRRNELTDLARQYERLAEKLISALGAPPPATDD
jgi:hypothetical protein